MKNCTTLFNFFGSVFSPNTMRKNDCLVNTLQASKNLPKQFLLMPLLVLVVLFGSGSVWGQTTGIYESYAILNINSGGNTYYDLNAATANSDFNNANLGTFLSGTNSLVFSGGENKTFKCSGGNVTGSNIYYRVYLSSGSGGSFTTLGMSFVSNDAGGCGGNQTWRINNGATNIISGLAAGTYTLEVYSDAPGSPSTAFATNGGANYKANFTVVTQLYSKSTGNLETLSNWGTNTDGTGTAPANFSTGGITYNIRNNATPTIGASWTVSGTGSKIIVGDGTNACNFTVPSTFIVTSPTTDVSNNGTITRTSSGVQSFGTLNVLAGGTYDHNYATGSLPTATWNSTSTLLISADLQSNNFSGITFGNVTFRNAAGTTMLSASANQTATIAGNLNLEGTGTIIMSTQPTGWTATVTVNGNVNISGNSTFRIESVGTASGTNTKTLLVLGNYIQSNGTMDLATNTTVTITANTRAMILEVRGNFSHTGGTITENATSTNLITRVLLSKNSGTQTLESTGQTNSVSFNVAGSNAQCVVSATKTFTLSSGSSMTIGAGTSAPDLSVSGTFLNQSSTALTVASATITINNGGTYVHNTNSSAGTPLAVTSFSSGSTMIYRGSSTLTPSISLSGRTYHHLMIESTSGALSLTGTGGSSLIINGDLTIGANCTFGPNITGTPGHSIKGNISIGSGGTLNYNPASAGTINLNGSGTQTISGAGTFTTGSNATLAVGASSTIDFGSSAAIAGTGTFTSASESSLITANTSGINGSLTLSNKTLNAGTNYTFNGSPAQVTGASLTAANNITLNNSNGLTLSANTSVTGTLTLTSGKFTTNGFTLALSNAVSGASSSNYIVADATGTATFNNILTASSFPIGTSSYYAPLTVAATSATNYTTYVTSTLPCSATDATKVINLAWGLSGSNTPSQVVFQWPAGSQAASFNPANSCDLGRYNAACPYNVTNIGAASGSGPYTLTTTSGISSTNNIYVIGNQHAVYIAAPTVTTTVAASSITNTTASSGGQTLSGTNITSKGVVWHTSTAPTVALSTKTNDGTGSADFTSSVTSLSPETLYYLRAYVTNAAGTGYGDEKTFRTRSNPATAQASSLIATATSSSNIDLTWNAATFPSSGATNKGYVLLRATSSNTPSLGNSNGAAPSAGANTTIVSSAIANNVTSISNSGIASSTQYNYLLIPYTWDGTNAATYNYLTVSAPTASATTQSGSTPPVLTTNAASSVLSATATLNGEITSDGGASVSARGFVYSISDNTPTIGEGSVTDQASGTGTGTFNSSVSSLSPNTTYYYQAYATNTSGTSYGGVISFTTLKAEPSAQPTSLVFSSVTTTSFNTAFTAATGSPDGYLVIRSTSSSLSADPVDGTTYTAGNSVGGGTVVSVGITISGISNSSLSAGTTYYTFVFAYNNSGSNIDYRTTSPLSASTITLTDAPATPTFSSITTTGFTVDWTVTTGASTYRLDVSTASNFASYVSGYQDLTVNTNSQVVTGLAANTLYYVRVRAVNASGTSANSTSANSATLSNAPTVGTASSITTSGLTANWTAPSSQGAVSFTYTVELSTSAIDFSSPVSTVSSIASSTITNAFSSLAEGTTYYYRIKAVNSAGNSEWSSVSAGTTTLTSSISLTALGTAVTENFDTLASTGTATGTPPGWYFSESGTGANTSLTAGTGSANSGDTYSFGTNTDRAFGTLRTGTVISTIGAKIKNNSGSTINNLVISYSGEQWRLGATGRTDRLDFQYSLDATSLTTGTWNDVNSLDFTAPNISGTTGPLNGNVSANLTAVDYTITGLTISDGANFFIRWNDLDATGADDGLAIDNFSIKGCGTVSAPTASDQAFCSAASPTVASLSATGTSIQWYSASSGGTALSSSTALTTATTYYATQTDGGCESVSRTAVVVTINTNPSVPTGTATQIFCSTSSPTVNELSATGTSIQWYEASTGGSALATNTSLVNSTIYYATQTVSGCESTTRLAVTASVVSSGTWLGNASTDWNTSANWCGGIPTSSTNVVINSGASNFPNLSTGADGLANSVTINSGGSLTIGGTETLTITAGGSFTNSGTFTAGSSTSVAFSGTGSIVGTTTFNNITTSGALTPSATTTINGTLTLNSGGTIATNSPIFGASSTLQYNYGGGFGARRNQALEWPASNGPSNLSITNGSWIQLTGNRSLTGNVTITSGALQASGGRSLTMNGTTQTLTISTTSGGAIYGTDNGSGNDLSLVIANGSTTTLTGDATSSSDDEKKFFGITVNAGGTLSLSRGVLCKYGTFAVNGTLQINANGYIQTSAGVAPTYGSSATLKYNSGNSYGRGLEWSAITGAGYPINVQISNNTTLDLGDNGGTGTARQCSGSLTVDSGSTITLNANPMSQALIVKGNYTNNGTTILSGTSGGDLKLEGDMNDNGVFTANGRAIFFEGGNTQTINSSTNPLDVDVMRIGKSGGEVILAQNLLVDETADPIQFTTAQSVLNLNGKTATFGKAGTASAITMNASSKIKGSSLSSLTILGSGNFGTLYFDQAAPGNTLNNLTITRSSGTFSIGNAVTIAGTLDAGSSSITGAGGITLPAAATLITSNASGVNGAFATSGSNSLSTAANYTFTGSTAQTTGTNLPATVNNFTISNTAGVTLPQSLTLNGTMSISGTGTSFTINPNAILTIAGTADFGGKSVTLKSDSSGTAAIGQVTGTLSNATNVTVERYIPAKRAWRALTAPLKGSNTSLYASWQNAGATPVSPFNTGVELWGPSGTGMATGPAYNIRQYTTSGWADVTNSQSTNLFTSSANNAYMVFVTGGYGSNNIGNGQSAATTLKATGQLITGPVSFAVTSARHTLVGNPFASPLSPSAILAGNTQANLYTNIWMWDPAISTNGAYVNYDASINSGTFSDNSGSYNSSSAAIQSGQAFFVRAVANTDTLTLTESMKSSSISNTFRNSNSIAASVFRLGFAKQIGTEWMPLDGCIAAFYDAANAAVDVADGTKMVNTYENIAFVRGTTNLSIEHYPLLNAPDQLNVKIWNTQQAHYKLKLNTEEFTMVGVEAWLQDLYTGTSQPLNLDGSMQEYEFDVDPTVSASSGNRFRIVFTNTALAVTNPEQGQLSIYPNPVTGGKVTVSLPTGNFEGCSYELINVLGQVVRQDEIANANSSQVSIPLTGLPNSWYALRIIKENSVMYQGKLIIKN